MQRRSLRDELQQTKQELASATAQLSDAKKKLGFLDVAKTRVQVTAYAHRGGVLIVLVAAEYTGDEY